MRIAAPRKGQTTPLPLLLLLLIMATLTAGIISSDGGWRRMASASSGPVVVASIPLGAAGYDDLAVNPATNRIYVTNFHDGTVSVVDGTNNTLMRNIKLPRYHGPVGIAVNPTTNRIYTTNPSADTPGLENVGVIDGATNKLLTFVYFPCPCGNGGPVHVAVNPVTNRVFTANGPWELFDGSSLSVIDASTNTFLRNIRAGSWEGPVGVAVNPVTDLVYTTGNDNVLVIDGSSYLTLATLSVGTAPSSLAVNPATNRIYVGNRMSDDVSVIDGATNTVVATIPLGDGPGPQFVAVNPTTNRIYVADLNTIYVIDGSTNAVAGTISMYNAGLTVNPTTNRLYVLGVDTLWVIEDQGGPVPPPTPTPPPPEEPLVYVGTGDSISAGADLPRGKEQAYPAVLCTAFNMITPTSCNNISNSGDDTDDYIHKQLNKAIKAKPDIVTVTVGADEIIKEPLRFRRIFTDCDVESARINMASLLTSLLYGTDALVFVTGYYNPLNPSNILWLNMEACVLEGNNAIHDVVVSLASTWPDRIVEVPLYESFQGHEFGTTESWISPCNQPKWACMAVGGVHPNELGQQAIADAIIGAMAE